MKELCWLRGLWSSLRAGANVSGHAYRETFSGEAIVQALSCDVCGHTSVGWTPAIITNQMADDAVGFDLQRLRDENTQLRALLQQSKAQLMDYATAYEDDTADPLLLDIGATLADGGGQ